MHTVLIATLAFNLIAAHMLADYPLQGDFLSRAKNRTAPLPDVPWAHAMTAHCVIHAAFVAWITGFWALGLAEFAIHFATDDAKCRGRINYNTDQAIHVACKIVWAFVAVDLIA